MPAPPRAATVRERFGARSFVPVSRSLTVAALAGLLAGCGAKEEPPAPAKQVVAEPAEPPGPGAAAGDAVVVRAPAAGEAAAADALLARLPGTYTRESYGLRTLTVREGGDATMTVDVDPFYQWMVGERITVEIAWEITSEPDAKSPSVHFESVSGTPKESFESVTSLFGSERDWTILSADDDALVLHDPESDETEVWARVADDADAAGAGG